MRLSLHSTGSMMGCLVVASTGLNPMYSSAGYTLVLSLLAVKSVEKAAVERLRPAWLIVEAGDDKWVGEAVCGLSSSVWSWRSSRTELMEPRSAKFEFQVCDRGGERLCAVEVMGSEARLPSWDNIGGAPKTCSSISLSAIESISEAMTFSALAHCQTAYARRSKTRSLSWKPFESGFAARSSSRSETSAAWMVSKLALRMRFSTKSGSSSVSRSIW
jgi:hypothetical protein